MLPDEAMSEAGRKAMYSHFLKMLANEAGTRLGEDIEALHDMRVSTRRMRAAYRIFADYYAAKAIAPFNKGLRRTGAMLGAVRDLDVLLEKAEAWQAMPPADPANGALPASEAGDQAVQGGRSLEPLLADWRTRREVARRQMLEYLDSPAYRRLVADFQAFLTTPGAGALPIAAGVPAPYQVRHVAPRLIFTRYEAVRAYEPILEGAPLTTYHALRIDFKRLRYELEFFREVLGPETPDLIKTTVAMQDLLGALQDAYVAEGLIGEFLAAQKAKRKKRYAGGELADVEAYLETQRAAQQTLVQEFPALWVEIIGLDFRRALALAVAAL
jgi:CHAD domain-containing protein